MSEWHGVLGDEVAMHLIVEAGANLITVEAVYACQEDPNITLVLDGVPDDVSYQDGGGSLSRRSKTLVTGEVGLEHIPGQYQLSCIKLYTAGGQTVSYDPRAAGTIEPGYPTLYVFSEETLFPRIYLSLGESTAH